MPLNRRLKSIYIPTKTDRMYIKVSVGHYPLSGGYYAFVVPVKKKTRDGCLIETFSPIDGVNVCLEKTTKRFSKKRLNFWANEEHHAEVIAKVASQNNLITQYN